MAILQLLKILEFCSYHFTDDFILPTNNGVQISQTVALRNSDITVYNFISIIFSSDLTLAA